MKVVRSSLQGLLVLEPEPHRDARGFFVETYHADRYRALGIDLTFVQDNHSRSTASVIRGLHYQGSPGQAKLIRVARGRILDVAVDIRPDSSTFGRHEAVILDDHDHRQLFVPEGFAHGFATLSDEADVVYKVGSYYDESQERGLAWDDPDIGIDWPVDDPIVSDRDRANPSLAAIARIANQTSDG